MEIKLMNGRWKVENNRLISEQQETRAILIKIEKKIKKGKFDQRGRQKTKNKSNNENDRRMLSKTE